LQSPLPFGADIDEHAHATVARGKRERELRKRIEKDAMGRKILFVGAGMMAEALAKGFVDAGVANQEDVTAVDPSTQRCEVFRGMGMKANAAVTKEIADETDVVIIAVKPQYVSVVVSTFRDLLGKKHLNQKLFVSIAAGITLAQLESMLGDASGGPRVVRVMPNTPCLVGATAAAMSLSKAAKDQKDDEVVKELFDAVGVIHAVDDKLIDAVTGVSGSGPAYIYLVIEAMADGGVRAGLPRDVAQSLAAQTVFGAAKMVKETGKHPGELKDAVTSPGGTTIAAVHELEKSGIRAAFMNAVYAAKQRGEELSKL